LSTHGMTLHPLIRDIFFLQRKIWFDWPLLTHRIWYATRAMLIHVVLLCLSQRH